MKRDLTPADRDRIIHAVAAGDRIEATSIYISIAECGLTEAQKFIHALTEEVKTTHPEKFHRRPQKRHLFGA